MRALSFATTAALVAYHADVSEGIALSWKIASASPAGSSHPYDLSPSRLAPTIRQRLARERGFAGLTFSLVIVPWTLKIDSFVAATAGAGYPFLQR